MPRGSVDSVLGFLAAESPGFTFESSISRLAKVMALEELSSFCNSVKCGLFYLSRPRAVTSCRLVATLSVDAAGAMR